MIDYIYPTMIQSRFNFYILVFLLSLLNATAIYYPQSFKFNNLTVENGLSNNDVNTLIQDKTGFIWFGTEDGLNRYDGYNFKVFRHNPSDSNSLADNTIWALMEDSKGFLWIGTKSGKLNRYDPVKESFTLHQFTPNIDRSSSIAALFEDSKGNIWIGTRTRGIYRLNPDSNEISHWNRNDSIPSSLSNQSVRAITEDKSGNIIIGTYSGLNKFNPSTPDKGFEKFFYKADDPNSLSDKEIYNLSKSTSDDNTIWIGTVKGLTKFNSMTNTFSRIEIPNPDKLQFGSGASTVIEELIDSEKILWIDTYSGFVRMNLNSGKSFRFVNDEKNPNSIIDNQINKTIKDRSGVIWVATENGISFYSSKNSKFNSPFSSDYQFYLDAVGDKKNLKAITQYENGDIWLGFSNGLVSIKKSEQSASVIKDALFNNLNVWSLAAHKNNSLWIGTFGQGLKQLDVQTKETKDWLLIYELKKTKTVPYIKSLFKDANNNIWVGYWGSGLARIEPGSGKYMVWNRVQTEPESLSDSDVWSIVEDRFNRIWIATLNGGLDLFIDKDEGKFRNWTKSTGNKKGLNSENVFTIYESKKGEYSKHKDLVVLWLGTSSGLNQFVITNNSSSDPYNFGFQINSYTIEDGLADNSVHSILEDEDGNLWLGTGMGISYFDVKNKTFTNFTTEDGLYGNNMNPGAAIKLDNGLMIFGSTKGLNIFDPKETKLSDYKPAVILTDFQIFNKSIEAGINSPLKKSITHTKEIQLSHNQDVFSFEFSALDYNSPQSIQYAYKMEGFDEDWIETENRRFVTYTNLNPGKYIFNVKSTNADGVWSNETVSLEVKINSPWWATLWAYGFYTILIIIGLLAIRRFEMNRTKLRNELRLREYEAKQKSQLEEMKSRFFANLSHEFRTPLTLIKGPIELLKNKISNASDFEQIDIIQRNSEKLKELIDQLLELSQLENTSLPLRTRKEDLISVLKGLVFSFNSLAYQKNISIEFQNNSSTKTLWIDRDKLEKIINNLLSNALKFTPVGGSVTVSVNDILNEEKSFTEIIVSDTGIGIPKDKLDNIFDRFYQVDDSTQRSYGGSGIGLALVKELVDLHKWKITVESSEGNGANFKLMIPLSEDYLNDSEKISDESFTGISAEDQIKIQTTQFSDQVAILDNAEIKKITQENKASLLIVEDSDDLRKYLSSLLKNDYVISEAANGDEGIKIANEILPDIIISDVMMPSMDGFEFCRQIKSDWHTSDIPIILLTAKASFESKLEGLEIGADDYLTKPFDSRELFVRIKNLLEQRKRIREKYCKDIIPLKDVSDLNSNDKDFTNRAYDIVEMNLDKTNFSTDQLAKELFLSRSQLHRKMISITGQAPGEFIRIIKLRHAAEMLLKKKLSVTQIAYEIGFSSPAQFSRAFSKQFNCTPSEYSSKQKA